MIQVFKKFFKYIVIFILISGFFQVYASTTNGTIDATSHSALLCMNDACTNTTRINFLTTFGRDVEITNSQIVGNVWSEEMGWINLNPTNGGVMNTDEGVLSGYAWGENAGWINFGPTNGGVTINDSGEFVGWAWAQNYGWIKFNCSVANACVKTDWRPGSNNNGVGGIIQSPAPIVTPPVPPTVTPPTEPSVTFPVITPVFTPPVEPPVAPSIISSNSPKDDKKVPKEMSSTDSRLTDIENVISLFAPQAVAEQMARNIVESFDKITKIIKEEKEKVVKIIETPTGDIISKSISATGIISGAFISVATVLLINPISFYGAFFLPFGFWIFILIIYLILLISRKRTLKSKNIDPDFTEKS